ncbi:MAG: PAS domain S-box protein, partial [Myxococcales bacterium]|nr:PAS domain S-box protein [Myxococcales bacterium]
MTDGASDERRRREVAVLMFALETAHEEVFLIDEAGRFHYVNDEVCRVLGYSHEELLAMTVP